MFGMLYAQQMGTGIVWMLPTQPPQEKQTNKQHSSVHLVAKFNP